MDAQLFTLCLTSPGGPFYFASDSNYAITLAKRYGRQRRAVVVARLNGKQEPLHLDKVPDWQQRPPSDYYDTFVDLYLLALGKCVACSMGGFGSWAFLISNSTCWIRHHTAPGITPCEWNDGPSRKNRKPLPPRPGYHLESLFVPPIDDS